MKITRIIAWRQSQPFRDGTYTCSGGRSAEGFDSTIVAIATDAGITGWGEMAPLGAFYAPAFAGGARAGITELAPHLIGEDPCQLRAIERLMDHRFNGHPYVKSALDMACSDTGGAEIDTAAMAHLSISTPAARRLHAVDFHNWVSVGHGSGLAPCIGGEMSAPKIPGLGIAVDAEKIGKPFLELGA